MQDVQDDVEQINQCGGPPVRSTMRLQPSSASQSRPLAAPTQQYERLKRKPPCSTEDLGDEEQSQKQLSHKALQEVCKEALECDRRSEKGQEQFDSQACTFVEAFGLFFDDCYDDLSRLSTAPRFEERVIIQMQVISFATAYCVNWSIVTKVSS